jgi:hypothetical protein
MAGPFPTALLAALDRRRVLNQRGGGKTVDRDPRVNLDSLERVVATVCGAVQCCAVWCDAVWCDAVWCDAVWCGVLMWCVVWGGVLSAALSEVVQGMVGEAVWGRVSEAVRQCVRRHGS